MKRLIEIKSNKSRLNMKLSKIKRRCNSNIPLTLNRSNLSEIIYSHGTKRYTRKRWKVIPKDSLEVYKERQARLKRQQEEVPSDGECTDSCDTRREDSADVKRYKRRERRRPPPRKKRKCSYRGWESDSDTLCSHCQKDRGKIKRK